MSAVRRWWALGGAEPVDLPSPLQVPSAAERIGGAAAPASWVVRRDPVVVGRVRGERVRLSLARPGRNSFRPVLRARLVPAPAGCRLAGEVGVHPAVRWGLRCWLLGVLAFTVGGAVGVVGELLAGDGAGALGVLPLPVVGSAMAAFAVVLSTVATRAAQADGPRLVAWAAEQLRSPAGRAGGTGG